MGASLSDLSVGPLHDNEEDVLPPELFINTWSETLFFFPDVGTNRTLWKTYKKKGLLSEFIREFFLANDEHIKRMAPFRHKLFSNQPGKGYLHHKYVVFVTSHGWYYSIDKILQGIILQRSKCKIDVTHYRIGKRRLEPQTIPLGKLITLEKHCTMQDIVSWLHCNDELAKTYHAVVRNCQSFATRFNNHFTPGRFLFLRMSLKGLAYDNDFYFSYQYLVDRFVFDGKKNVIPLPSSDKEEHFD